MSKIRLRKIGIALVFFILLSTASFGQFGVRAFYGSSSFNDFQSSMRLASQNPNYSFFSKSMHFGVDYWIRMKDFRLEFYPELAYGRSSTAVLIVDSESREFSFSHFEFNLNAHIYLLDFLGDCECPTFSKQGDLFKKGFFVLFAPGVGLSNQTFSSSFEDSQKNLFPKIAFGAGLDLGINDLITISPILRVSYVPSISWDSFGDFTGVSSADENSPIWYYQFGLRLGFRPDYKRPGR